MYHNIFPKSPEGFKIYHLGMEAFKMKDYKGAAFYFSRITEREPEVSSSWYLLLESLFYLEKWAEMIEIGNKAVRIHPKNGSIFMFLGEAYLNQGKRKKGVKALKNALSLLKNDLEKYPNDDTILNCLGEINIRLGNYEEAITFSEKASEINPKSKDHLHSIGLAYKEMKNYDQAIIYYKKSLEIDPEHSYAWFDLGLIYEDLKDSKKAIECYEKAVECSPQWVKLRKKLTELEPNSIVLFKKTPDIRMHFNEMIAKECAQSESLYNELTEISNLLKKSDLSEEEKKYHEQKKLNVIDQLKQDLIPREQKVMELKKLIAEAHELIIQVNETFSPLKEQLEQEGEISNDLAKELVNKEARHFRLRSELKDIANLVEQKRKEIYKTEKNFKTILTTPTTELGPKELRTLWECMKLTCDMKEALDLMREETDFYKEMIIKMEKSLEKNENLDRFDKFEPKGMLDKFAVYLADKKTKKLAKRSEKEKENNQT